MGAVKDAVRVVFRGPRVSDLFDRDWHKIALSIQAQNVSLYVDCTLVQTLPIEERENIDIQGKTVIGKRLYDSVPIDVSTGALLQPRSWGHWGKPRESGVPGSPSWVCTTYQDIALNCLRREDPDSETLLEAGVTIPHPCSGHLSQYMEHLLCAKHGSAMGT